MLSVFCSFDSGATTAMKAVQCISNMAHSLLLILGLLLSAQEEAYTIELKQCFYF